MQTGFAIECRGLVKRYGDVTAVDGLDLAISPGECFGLLGPNGAGKTTTIEILEGLNRADSGEVTVLGRHWGTHEQELRERLGVSLQESRFLDKLTVFETLRLFRSFYREGKDPEEALRDLSLEEKRDTRVMKLSGGQRQRLAVACALTGNPAILFLDEPTTGLDPQSRRQLWEHIRAFRARGGTVLLTTHYMEEAEQLCDRVAIVDHGKVIAEGTPAQLIGRLRAPHILDFSSDPPAPVGLVSRIPGAFEPRQRGNHWSVSVTSLAEAIPALLADLEAEGGKLEELSTRRAMLEDVFLALTGRELRDE
ncbi:MAG TPA: ABC transporter ATP-binding protein [Thermoanaerobaculia bacterium]|nr:ABC transporter ATP-binding protein [Thermoanaerobaculia bacterium]